MVATLGDAALHGTLEIEPAKLVLARDTRDHAKAQLPPGAAAGSHPHPFLQRLFDVGRFVRGGANFLQRRGCRAEAVAIANKCKQILDRARGSERVGARRAEDCHPGALGHRPAPQLAYRRTAAAASREVRVARCGLFRRDTLEAGLRVRDINVRGEPQRGAGWLYCGALDEAVGLGKFDESGGLDEICGLVVAIESDRLVAPIESGNLDGLGDLVGLGGFVKSVGLSGLEWRGGAREAFGPIAPDSTSVGGSRIVRWRRIVAPPGAGRATHLLGASHVLARLGVDRD